MAKSIQDLRRERGFRSSREFAEALGVSPSSMSRYDHDAFTIPIKVAWAMADLLGCSIDEVVGRQHVTSGRSDLQEDYDSLNPEVQLLVSEFMEFAKAKNARHKSKARLELSLKYDNLCQFYERLFYQSLYGQVEFGEPVVFASSSREREAFREFVTQKAAEKRGKLAPEDSNKAAERSEKHAQEKSNSEKRDEEVIEAIMDAYDRRHGCEARPYRTPSTAVE